MLRVEGDQSLVLNFVEVGADFDEPIRVEETSLGLIQDGAVILATVNGLTRVDLTFDRDVLGGIKLHAAKGLD